LIPSSQHLDRNDIFPALARDGWLRAYHSAEYFKDFGTPDRLARVRLDFESGKTARLSRGHLRPAVFLDRDGVINKEVSHLSNPAQMELISGSAESIRRLNEAGYLAIVVTNQPVVARGECSLDALRLIHNKMETLLGWSTPDHALSISAPPSRQRFSGEVPELKVDCVCRKPKTGMSTRRSGLEYPLPGSYSIETAAVT
jgi:HAD superfamily hydrolase (TIGR01662 family)